MLTKDDRKHYGQPDELTDWLAHRIPSQAVVLDVGPGGHPFKRANVFVDFNPPHGMENVVKCNLAVDPLPFPDKSFDFVYCRHVLEDMFNPFPLIAEMSRVGKAGYIETPSPIAEMCRGVDGDAHGYRGYYHHRFLCWVQSEQLCFVSKYSLIEHEVIEVKEEAVEAALRAGPKYWNTYYLWEGNINARHIQHPIHFHIWMDYGGDHPNLNRLIWESFQHSERASDKFWAQIPAFRETIPVMGLRSFQGRMTEEMRV